MFHPRRDNPPPPLQLETVRRAQDDTCQTVTGIAVAAQKLRPDTWCRESPERLGRAAVVAVAAAGGSRIQIESRNGGMSRKIGGDGLRRCGRPRPPMFKPTAVAGMDDGAVRARPKGEVRDRSIQLNVSVPLLVPPKHLRVSVACLCYVSGSDARATAPHHRC